MKEKLEYIDAIRGFAMLLVVISHVLLWTLYSPETKGWRLYSPYIQIHMPLFAFVSGLLFRVPISADKLWNKIKRLMIPFLFWGIAFSISHGMSVEQFFMSPYKNGYWYLEVLALLYIFMSLVFLPRCMIKHPKSIVAYMLVLPIIYYAVNVGAGFLPHNIFLLLSVTPLMQTIVPFGMGMLVTNFEIQNKVLECNYFGLIIWVCYIAMMAVGVFEEREGLMLIAYNLGVWAWLFFFKYVKWRGTIYRILRTVGQYSLQIYVLHYFIVHHLSMTIVGEYCVATGCYGLDLLSAVVLALLISWVCVMIARIGSQYTYSRILLEGR